MRATLLAMLLVSGCAASAVDTARETLRAVARASNDADGRLEARINAASDAELARNMDHFDAATRALGVLRRSLLVAEDALDTWEVAGEANGFLSAIGCVAAGVRDVAWAFAEAGMSVPFSVAKAEHALREAPSCGVGR